MYDAIDRHGIRKAAIPPRRDAKIWRHGNSKAERVVRDENLRAIRRKGRKAWKRESAYHRRGLAETAMFRFKTIFTGRLRSRKQENQFAEMPLKCAALNRMTHLGMPDTYNVAA